MPVSMDAVEHFGCTSFGGCFEVHAAPRHPVVGYSELRGGFQTSRHFLWKMDVCEMAECYGTETTRYKGPRFICGRAVERVHDGGSARSNGSAVCGEAGVSDQSRVACRKCRCECSEVGVATRRVAPG